MSIKTTQDAHILEYNSSLPQTPPALVVSTYIGQPSLWASLCGSFTNQGFLLLEDPFLFNIPVLILSLRHLPKNTKLSGQRQVCEQPTVSSVDSAPGYTHPRPKLPQEVNITSLM